MAIIANKKESEMKEGIKKIILEYLKDNSPCESKRLQNEVREQRDFKESIVDIRSCFAELIKSELISSETDRIEGSIIRYFSYIEPKKTK
ncbi:hypothetical protein KAT63_02995 [Candidatus Parcubacteria bacterium]|nr:hypothetical protein [Candidatus Parcubacteria bacterium]